MIGENAALSRRQTYEEMYESGTKTFLWRLNPGDRFLAPPLLKAPSRLSGGIWEQAQWGPVRSWVVNQEQIGGQAVDVTDEDNGDVWRLQKSSGVVRLVEGS